MFIFSCFNNKKIEQKQEKKQEKSPPTKNHYSFSYGKKKKKVTHSKQVTIATSKAYPHENSESLSVWKLP